MNVVCFIHYRLDPFKLELFRRYAVAWTTIIPRCGGHLLGYFVPYESANDEGWGLIGFDSLAAYEAYRRRLKADDEAQANFAFAVAERFIVGEERRFNTLVPQSFDLAPAA